MTSYGRVARLTALALATGTLVAAGAGSAGAATTTKTTYTATGGGNVVALTLNLPVALPAPIGSTITQNLVTTGAIARTSGLTSAPAAVSKALLGSNGNVPLVSGLLDRSVTAEYGKNATASDGGILPENPLLAGGALTLLSKVANPDVQGTLPVAYGKSSVLDLKIDAGQNLTAVLNAIVAQLETTLTGIVGTTPSGAAAAPVGGVTTTLTDVLGGLATSLPALPVVQDAAPEVQDLVNQISGLLNNLPQALSQKLTAATDDTSLLKIGLIQSEQTITHQGGVVTSKATNALENISALGGLIKLTSLTSEATAALGNGTSDADAKGHASVLKLDVDGVLSLEITNQLQTILASPLLPAEVVKQVQDALNAVTTTLTNALGAVLVPAKTGEIVKTENRAAAKESAAHLVIQPMGFAKPIIDLSLVPAEAEVVKAQAAVPSQQITPAKAGAAPKALAQTGAELPLTGAVAAALMGLAAIARRRRAGLAE